MDGNVESAIKDFKLGKDGDKRWPFKRKCVPYFKLPVLFIPFAQFVPKCFHISITSLGKKMGEFNLFMLIIKQIVFSSETG